MFIPLKWGERIGLAVCMVLSWVVACVSSPVGCFCGLVVQDFWEYYHESHKMGPNYIVINGVIHPWRLTWNIIMEVQKIIFLIGWFVGSMLIFQGVIVITPLNGLFLWVTAVSVISLLTIGRGLCRWYIYIYRIYLNPRRVWNLSPLTTKNRPGGWNLTPLEDIGI